MAEPIELEPGALLEEQLDNFAAAALKTLATRLGIAPVPNRRDALISSLVAVIGSPAHRALLETKLDTVHWFVLNLLPLRLGPVTAPSLLMALRQQGEDGKDALRILSSLLANGALLPASPAGPSKLSLNLAEAAHTVVYLSLTLAPGVGDWATEHVGDTGVTVPTPVDPPGEVLGSALLDLQRTTFVVTAESGRKPIKLTTAGLPYKADATRLGKALAGAGVRAERSTGAGTDPVPPLLYFAVAQAAALGLLQQTGEGLTPHESLRDFLALPLEDQAANFLAAYVLTVFNDFAFIPTLTRWYGHDFDPWLRSSEPYAYTPGLTAEQMTTARGVIIQGIVDIAMPAPDAWYSIDDLALFVFSQAPDLLFARVEPYELIYAHLYGTYYTRQARRQYPGMLRVATPGTPDKERALYMDTDWEEVEGAFIRQVVTEGLRWLGLVEVDRPPPGGQPTRFRLTDLGRHFLLLLPLPTSERPAVSGRVVVQPNFDVVVVDSASNWGLLAQLDAFAERRTLDRAATYQLTQAALVRGLDQGFTGQRVVEVLEDATGSPLPQNVLYSLREWAALYEALTVREHAALLEADSAEQLDRMFAHQQIAPLLGRRLGPRTVLVPHRHMDRLVGRFNPRSFRTVDYAAPPTGVVEAHDPDVIEVAERDVEPYLQYRLEQIAAVVESGEAGQLYQITRDAVAQATAAGWTGKELLDFLVRASRTPVPPDVAARLLGWSGAIKPLPTEQLVGVVLQAERPTWAELRKIKPIGRLIRALPTPVLALVLPEDLDRLRAELEERGITLEAGSITEAVDVKERRAALRAALQAFDNPGQVLRDFVAQGVIKSADLYGHPY